MRINHAIVFRAPNKMTLHSNGLFRLWTASGCIDNAEQKPASPSAPKRKRSFSVLRFILIGTLSLMFVFFSQVRAEEFRADLVVVSANVITVDDGNRRAEAFAVKNGKFIAVGTNSQIKKLIGKDTDVIDAQGKTITPGFIDAHLHPGPVYPVSSRLGKVDLRPDSVKSMDELINALREKAKTTPEGQWVFGSRYQDTKLGRHPTRRDLDKASTKHPISISHSSGHVRVVNSSALKNAKINRDTPDPPGGGFDRDENRIPNGICREGAGGLTRRGNPSPPSATREEKLKGYELCFKNYLSKGITSVGDAGTSGADMSFYQELKKRGTPVVRIYNMLGSRYLPRMKDLYLDRGFGNEWLKLGAIKFFHGNSLSGRTCWLYEPYDMINPKTGKKDYYGIPPGRSREDLDKLVRDIHKAGFQVACHANGDREIDMVLDAIEKALQEFPRNDHRHRIEHCSVVNPRILKRIKKLGVVLALHSYVYEHGDKMEDYGSMRWPMMHANRSALKMGIMVAGNSDSPVSAAEPLLRIQSMVTRKTAEGKVYGSEQKASVEDAIRIWTMGSAYASFEEGIKGSIETGKLADFVILSRNPTQVSPDSIKDIDVEKTFVGGRLVFAR
ncbi:MAG: amidohydrolase [Planctomycetes bacterium]|nr:amidohydrolase [Planctomycetota bacterium]